MKVGVWTVSHWTTRKKTSVSKGLPTHHSSSHTRTHTHARTHTHIHTHTHTHTHTRAVHVHHLCLLQSATNVAFLTHPSSSVSDGIPMDFSKPIDFSRTLAHGGGVSGSHDDDLDGIPMDDDLDGEPMESIPLAKDDSPRETQLTSGEAAVVMPCVTVPLWMQVWWGWWVGSGCCGVWLLGIFCQACCSGTVKTAVMLVTYGMSVQVLS